MDINLAEKLSQRCSRSIYTRMEATRSFNLLFKKFNLNKKIKKKYNPTIQTKQLLKKNSTTEGAEKSPAEGVFDGKFLDGDSLKS